MVTETVGTVARSALDDRVWVAVLFEGYDQLTGAMGASTSLRRCKAHVEDCTRASFAEEPPAEFVWIRDDDGEWVCEARWPH